ncbi:MAG: 1-deoxy-D-xylulose-5-phosphate reductoisomerase [Flammeovirgaceae bacterium]|nr:1-deoxy-D-xylulose-5-phosphate reductoisomerase [Flammeovirgaceae bacterium]MEC7851301.1 1-deoxy-D-xylulose-5-phosphate reductoisomerase [Bacteroidota bacterium]MEC8702029.1 1-deoxy-D-xylulose-5-phosphate reductoisomerase [Bacteroidota bacterium]
MKKVAILGSTGSIGTQTLEVISDNKNIFEVELLTAFSNHTLLINQALLHKPKAIIFGDRSKEKVILNSLKNEEIEIYFGEESLNNFLNYCNPDIVLTALVGKSGLIPTINTIKKGIDLALANKETLVVAGSIINKLCKEKKVNIYPVDSEHSAIFQCLVGESRDTIDKIILTASGGPFRNKKLNELKNISKKEALNHPNWEMGEKITIDSSTLMNKGLEVIEAKFLFDIDIQKIKVVVHPQSIIHSMVEFNDGSIKAQLGEPDMKLPIQYALFSGKRLKNKFTHYDFIKNNTLTFEEPCLKTFNNLKLAFDAGKLGGNAPCILNASNEIVVDAFLNEKIRYLDMTKIIEDSLNKISYIASPNLDQLIETDIVTRKYTLDKINKL